MNKLKAYNSALLFMVLGIILISGMHAQPNKYPFHNNEKVYVHLDKSVYIAGENLRYKVYAVNASDPGKPLCSKILYFTLSGTNGEFAMNWRINLPDKPVAGSIIIPDHLKAGMYEITAYTNWMRNGDPSAFFTGKVLIVNLSEEVADEIKVFDFPSTIEKETPENHEYALKLVTSKKSYSTRDMVKMEVDLQNSSSEKVNAELSVSVIADSPLNHLLGSGGIKDEILPVRATDPRFCKYPVEDKGFILSGRITGRGDNLPVAGCNVWLAVTDSIAPEILYSVTDSSGTFVFYLNRMYDNKELILQLADQSKIATTKLTLDNKAALGGDTASYSYLLMPDELKSLNTARNIRLVEAIYTNKEETVNTESRDRGLNFFGKPDKICFPGDYAEMRNFREIANNIIPEIKFNFRKDLFFLQVLSPGTNVWKDCKVVLLNGVPFTDLSYISTLGSKEIQRIEIIQSNVLIGELTFPGLVAIYTHDHKIPENYLTTRTVRIRNPVMEVYETEHFSSEEKREGKLQDGHFPLFKNNLYWDPFIGISSSGKISIEFPAIMLTGRFNIVVNGITDKGYPLNATASFEITE